MNDLSLRERIISYFTRHNDRQINGGDIERLALNAGYKASNASRRLRELAEERFLLREERKGNKVKSVYYKLRDTL